MELVRACLTSPSSFWTFPCNVLAAHNLVFAKVERSWVSLPYTNLGEPVPWLVQSQNPLNWDHVFVIVNTIGCLPCVCNYCNITDSSPGYMCVGCCFPVQVVMIAKRRLKGTWSIMSPQCDHMDLVRLMISFPLWRLSVSKLFHCHGFLFMTMDVYLCLKHFQFP